jgi:hypothetical protein
LTDPLAEWLVGHVRALSPTAPYRPPTTGERTRAVTALAAVLAGQDPDLTGLPLQLLHGPGRSFTLLTDTPPPNAGWGAIALRGSPTLLIEVPHPGSDRFTARLGLELFHAIPDAALLVAGAHRNAAGTTADVAHHANSLFHAFAQALATTEIQLHGFAATSAADTDVVLSPGAGEPTALHHELAQTLACHGFRLRPHEHLAGRTNVQGAAAAARGTPFLHLELAPHVRRHHRDRVVEAIADTWQRRGARHRGGRHDPVGGKNVPHDAG